MTEAEAKVLRDEVFGPCTTLYECMSLYEIVEEHRLESVNCAAWFEFDLESIRIDRAQGATENDDTIREYANFLQALEQRVRETYGPREEANGESQG